MTGGGIDGELGERHVHRRSRRAAEVSSSAPARAAIDITTASAITATVPKISGRVAMSRAGAGSAGGSWGRSDTAGSGFSGDVPHRAPGGHTVGGAVGLICRAKGPDGPMDGQGCRVSSTLRAPVFPASANAS